MTMAKAKQPGTVTSIDSRRKTNNTAKTAKAVETIREGKAPAAAPAPKAKTSKKGRHVAIGRRTVAVNNMNFSPEAAGDKLVERVDLSLEVLLERDDIEDVVLTRGNPLQVLWDKNGEPQLRELDRWLTLDLKVVGVAQLGLVKEDDEIEFEAAVLKKVRIEPMLGFKATMTCQVRVDPTDHLEELAQMVIDRKATFSFTGAGVQEKADGQGKLDV
jgi:hypothetical protein